MSTILRHTLAKSRGQIFGWGLSLALLGVYLVSFYDTFAAQEEQMQQLLNSFPDEMMAFFGNVGTIFTPEGYLTVEFFSYMPLVLGIYAVLIASGLIASEEESGVLDLVLGHPVSRSGYFFGRILAFTTSTILMFAIVWLSFVLAGTGTTLGIAPLEMAQPFLSLLAVTMLFGSVALALSQVLPSRRLTAMVTGLVVVASYFITSLANIDENLESIARFSPLNYYQSGEAINGLHWASLGGLLGFAALFTLFAGWRFQRRDLRVGGEGGWNLRLKPRIPREA